MTLKIKFGIFQKGLCLVLIPLVVNSLLLLLLGQMRTLTSHSLSAAQLPLSRVVALSSDIARETALLTRGCNAILNSDYKRFHGNILENLDRVEQDLDKSSATAALSDGDAKNSSVILEEIRRQRRIFLQNEEEHSVDAPIMSKVGPLSAWFSSCNKSSELLSESLLKAHEIFLRQQKTQKEYGDFTAIVLPFALIANLIVAFILAGWFHRDIANRLQKLALSAQMLPRNQRFSQPIDGDDELSRLGQELAQASSDLSDAAEIRKTLMQMMAHDVRNPLMAVDVSVAVLTALLEEKATPETDQSLKSASTSIAECLSLVNDLLLLESIENGVDKPVLSPCDLKMLFVDAMTAVETFAVAKSVEIVDNVKSQTVTVDQAWLKLSIQKLLLSAINRAPQGSKIICTTLISSAGFELSVRDDGQKVSRTFVESQFDKFCVAKQESGIPNFGLGLSVARPLVELHKGKVGLESANTCNLSWLRLPVSLLVSNGISSEAF